MEEFIAREKDWINYANAVGDHNLIHRDDKVARKNGLREKTALGGWIFAHCLGEKKISEVGKIKFPESVYDGDRIRIGKTLREGGVEDYEFKKEEKVVCEVRGVKFGETSDKIQIVKNVIYRYPADANPKRMNMFLSSLGYSGDNLNPNIFLLSLIPPALLGLGKTIGLSGFHASQSFYFQGPYDPKGIGIFIGDEKKKRDLHYFKYIGAQRGNIVFSGRIGTAPFDLESKVNSTEP